MQIKANGIKMNFELSGKKDAPIIVLSHSLSCSINMWDSQMEALKPHYQVLRYDTRGHGKTDAPSGKYTFDMLGEDAICLLDALGIDVVHWVGLSMGGMIGQCLALNYADRLHSLTLCDTTAIMSDDRQPVWQDHIDTALNQGMQSLVQSTMERWFTAPYLSKNPPKVQLIRRQFLETPVAGYVGCSEAIRAVNYLEQLHQINKPTLIMVGEKDLGTPVTASQAMHERIPNSRLVVLPSAAHLSNVEQPEAFNEALMGFLQEIS
jgi:3-oxoadipate enol-lactonase